MNSLKLLNSSNTIKFYRMMDVPYKQTGKTFSTPYGARSVNMYVVYTLIASSHLLQGSGDLEVHWSSLVGL